MLNPTFLVTSAVLVVYTILFVYFRQNSNAADILGLWVGGLCFSVVIGMGIFVLLKLFLGLAVLLVWLFNPNDNRDFLDLIDTSNI